jgi:hypothetical protein
MLRIVGDINLADGYFDTGIGVGSGIKNGLDPFKYLQRKESDFWIGNMECVCAETSNKEGLKSKQFRISPHTLNHVRHFDFYGVANNHVMQHGEKAYSEMLNYFSKNNIAFAGSKDKHTHRFIHQGKLVSITAFSLRPDNFSPEPCYWSMPELKAIEEEMALQADCDYRIVFIHWGNEFINFPNIAQKRLAHYISHLGGDLIIGMHQHRLQGYEQYNDSTIFYSLGNFVFNMAWEPSQYAVIINVDLMQATPAVTFEYIKIGKDFCPKPTTAVPKEYRMERLNELLLVNEENEKYFKKVFLYYRQYKRANHKSIIGNFLRMKPKDSLGILNDFIRRKV